VQQHHDSSVKCHASKTFVKQFVIVHRNSFLQVVCGINVSLTTNYSLVKQLENVDNSLGGKTLLSHSLGNLYCGDEQHTGQQKVRSFCFGNSFWHQMPLDSQ
jgi:hypothetical protein